jgi:hypothetical protein
MIFFLGGGGLYTARARAQPPPPPRSGRAPGSKELILAICPDPGLLVWHHRPHRIRPEYIRAGTEENQQTKRLTSIWTAT